MIPREKCLEWANEIVTDDMQVFIESLINRAYAEGQRDMRERAANAADHEHGTAGDAATAIRALEIE